MAEQSRKWMILVATIWIQAFTGTNFDFSAYSSDLKSVIGASQVQLNYLATASDLGKLFGWSSGLALVCFPLWDVLFMAAFMGFVGYGLQWLVITEVIALPYLLIFLLCLLSGLSITWFNTVCFVLCIRNFPENRALALSLTVSFNGVSAAIYALAGTAINPSSNALYLLLNALVPLIISLAALVPILRQPSSDPLPPDGVKRESHIFLILNIAAVFTGVYLLFGGDSFDLTTSRILFCGALFLLIFPLCVPGIVNAMYWFKRKIHSRFKFDGSGFLLAEADDLELHIELLARQASSKEKGLDHPLLSDGTNTRNSDIKLESFENEGSIDSMIGKDQLVMLGEEHSARMLVRRLDFWLYFIAYFCGGTIGLVYSNNLGQIAQSLGQTSETTTLLTLYSSFSFFGRLLSAAPDYMRAKVYFARTGCLAIALLPTPVALCLLATSGNTVGLQAGTALIGLSSGFIFAAAVSITSELFGPNSVGVNHNILITNIPIGSLVYGLLAAMVYDSNASSGADVGVGKDVLKDSLVCVGRHCYFLTFVLWGCLSVVGLAASLLLFLRTRQAYDRFERKRLSTTQLF